MWTRGPGWETGGEGRGFATLVRWLVMTLSILAASYLLPGVRVEGFPAALVAALVLGLLNAFVRPLLILFTLPLTLLTLGVSILVINAFLVLATSALVPGFSVAGFWWALLFSLVLSLVSFLLNRVRPG